MGCKVAGLMGIGPDGEPFEVDPSGECVHACVRACVCVCLCTHYTRLLALGLMVYHPVEVGPSGVCA